MTARLPSPAALAALAAMVALAVAYPLHPCRPAPAPGALREVYTQIAGSALADLTNNAAFPASPAVEEILPTLEAPSEWGENYGQRIRALLLPPATGNYVFWIAGDDQSALFLSTDESAQTRRLIASVGSWTSSREWTKEPGQKSTAIRLEAGRRYLIEALQKEGGGGDNLAVRWQLPDGRIIEPIQGTNLLVVGLSPPVITRGPSHTTAVEGGTAGFAVTLERNLGAAFQWWRSGQPIPAATNAALTLGPVALADSNTRFRVVVSNSLGSVSSPDAILTVVRDTTPPTLLAAANLGDPRHVVVQFSEPVETSSASRPRNYSLDRGAQVLDARPAADGAFVLLETTPLQPDATYTLLVTGVRDRGSIPNPVPPGSTTSFSLAYPPLDVSRIDGTPESTGPSTRRGAIVVSEIHYHPPSRADGRNREFLELHNPLPWPVDLAGWSLSGDVEATLPPGTSLPARGHLVLAASPDDLAATDGLSAALPYSGALGNDGGRIRLRNASGAVLWETRFSDAPPWPVAPDEGGHSLILTRPTLGERDPRAWASSSLPGGSPGTTDPANPRPAPTVRLNEILAHTDDPQRDFVELFNYGPDPVDLSGCSLSDDPSTNRFVIPPDTVLPPRGFRAFTQDELGFALDGAGETLWFRHIPSGIVLDALRFGGQANGVAFGRTPDGATLLGELAEPTPGAANAPHLQRPVFLNEIAFEPAGGETGAEFVELRNRGPLPVSLGGWRLRGTVSFEFPPLVLPAGGCVVAARDPARLRALHPSLTAATCFGPYSGSLANRGGPLRLSMPDEVVSTNSAGLRTTNTIHIVVDETDYRAGGAWPRLAAGGGSTLERLDPRLDGRLAAAWTASDESSRSDWVTVQTTGTADLGMGAASALELLLLGAGECLVDDVQVLRVAAGESNRLANPGFDAGLDPWFPQGNQSHSEWSPRAGTGDSPCLLLRATGRGDTANRVRVPLRTPIPPGARVTLRARARWLRGNPEFLMRLHGNWLESTTNLLTTRALGSPGAPNPGTASPPATPPSIDDVRHQPLLPANRQAVTVTARVADPDGLATVILRYRTDPATNLSSIAMVNRGAGYFSATIPGQNSGTLVAFHVEAVDAASPTPAVARFPADAPAREALVRWGEPAAHASFGSYRIWASQRTLDTWTRREALSNDLLDVTVVLGRDRAVYNVGARYSGSPYHTPGYNSPVGNFCDYQLTFPEDDTAFAESDVNLLLPGNGCCEGTMVREQMAYAIADALHLPFNHTRPVHVFLNGQRRAPMLMIDSQQANGDFVEQWWPDRDDDGDLHKIALWFEFDDALRNFDATGASFGNFTSGGLRKLARYRWNWPRRASPHDPHNYTNLLALHDAMLTTGSGPAYTQRLQGTVDPDNWARTVAVEHLVGNTDSFAYGGGQNMFVYKPADGRWSWLIWDIDFAFQADAPTNTVFSFGGGDLSRFLRHPPFFRLYYRALQEALDGPLSVAFAHPFLDARYSAFRAAGLAPESPQSIKSYLASRRDYLTRELARWNFQFRVTTPPEITATANPVVIQGVAPLPVETIAVNGVPWPVQWTSASNWTLRLPLTPGSHALSLQAHDPSGKPAGGAPVNLAVSFTGDADPALGAVFLNEWMADNRTTLADPADGDFNDWIELVNISTNTLQLAGYFLANSLTNRTQWAFPSPTSLDPGAFLLVWADGETNQTSPAALHTPFRLNRDGETLALFNPSGLLLDSVQFGRQVQDVSMGRFPDGALLSDALLSPTPRSRNLPGRAAAATQLQAEWNPDSGTLRITWPTVPGLAYRIEATDQIDAGAWESIGETVAQGPSATTTLDTSGSPRRFYRILTR